jgi:hypothetical protein
MCLFPSSCYNVEPNEGIETRSCPCEDLEENKAPENYEIRKEIVRKLEKKGQKIRKESKKRIKFHAFNVI